MKSAKFLLLAIIAAVTSCAPGESGKKADETAYPGPIDQGFSAYISSYSSGIVPVNAPVEIRFTQEFARKADRKRISGLFEFDPAIKGSAEWTDSVTLQFSPSRMLEPGKTYRGFLNIHRLGTVENRLKRFPLYLQTVRKDFSVIVKNLESSPEGGSYSLNGELITSDYIDPAEIEKYMTARLGRNELGLQWDHTAGNNTHVFSVGSIIQKDEEQELVLSWDGTDYGIKQKATTAVRIPRKNDFSIQNINVLAGESPRIEIVLSEPSDPEQDTEGLIWFTPSVEASIQAASNIITIFPMSRIEGTVELTVEGSLRSSKGVMLGETRREKVTFTSIMPGIKSAGRGMILPASGNLVFPFMTASLRAVDLKIIKIFENNLPFFLQENDLNESGYTKRFGRPVYTGRVDLLTDGSAGSNSWKLNTIDLSDYITVEPGILYRIELGMRKSYSVYRCDEESGPSRYEEILNQSEAQMKEWWEDPQNYYGDYESSVFYSVVGYDWNNRQDPCKEAYFSPDRRLVKNMLASNLGVMAKMGEDRQLRIFVNDIRTTAPVADATAEIYDFQLQTIGTASTIQDGTATVKCSGKPFLVIVKKGPDRNYLKINDGNSLSLSSFDISGVRPEKGIKCFIYGERDVWRPGDSIYLSVILRDMKKELPAGHPVQFELINPKEQRINNQVRSLPESGLLVFRTKTSDDAITGYYNAVIRVGGASFTKTVRIETVKPNRLRVELNFPGQMLGGAEWEDRASLKAKWLNGAIAKELKASVDVLLKPVKTSFPGYPQYEFDDAATTYMPRTSNIFEGSTDINGEATFGFDPGDQGNAPGMLNALFTARVFEKGGDASIIQKSFRYSPFKVYAGISIPALSGKNRLLYTDADNEIKIATVGSDGKPVSASAEISIYKISYRWWWEAGDEDLGRYVTSHNYAPVLVKNITTSGGEGTMTFRIPKNAWGRYLIRAKLPSGHVSGKVVLVDWPWEYGSKGSSDGATLLAVSTDREKYSTGEIIQISFPAPKDSRAIITLENATGVIDQMVVNTTGSNSVVNLKATPEMAPNVYAYVTLLQPHGQTGNDMPVRLYGVTPVIVENPETHLTPRIVMPDEIRSRQTFEVSVSEEGRKAMAYTIAIVDEGLLDITGYTTPDPWKYFYAREALGVKTWDIYDYVLGSMGGSLDRALATGGDEALKDKASAKAKRFIPVVRFFGPFTLAAGRTNRHSVTLPNYTGSVKTMVIAGSENAFGMAEKQVTVKDPLMVLATLPRVLSPGDRVALPLTLFIQKDNINKVTVTPAGNDLISFADKSRDVLITDQGEKDAELGFVVAERTGKAEIRINAAGGGEKAEYSAEIDVRSPNPPETRTELKLLSPGERFEKKFTPFGMDGTASASVELSVLPGVNLKNRIGYLVDYPHLCSEQVTSAVFPLLWIDKVAPENREMVSKAPSGITSGINVLLSRQMNNGGIALWPGSYQPDNWVTSYAGHFMTEAERLGYNIPAGFKQKWLRFQKSSAQSWRYDKNYRHTANDQAYRLFTLALAGQPDKGAMNRFREIPDLPRLSRWLLAAAYAASGRNEVSEALIDIRDLSTEADYYDYYYGSSLRDKAIILYTLTMLSKTEQALPLLKSLCEDLNRDDWYSTHSIAWGLFAYMKFADLVPAEKNSPAKVVSEFNGTKREIVTGPGMIGTDELKIRNGENSLSVENVSQNPVYMTFIQKGVPFRSDLLREDKGLTMTAEYVNMDMQPLNERSLEQGTDFVMVVRITNNAFRFVDNIALTQMVPSGWEIQNTRLFEAATSIRESTFDYRDFRDDRVYTYFSLNRGETKTFVLILNAAYKGTYSQPAVICEAMYRENCFSRIPGKEVEVTGQKLE